MKTLLSVLLFACKCVEFMFAWWNVFVRALIKEDYFGFRDSDKHLGILLILRAVSFFVIMIT
jgi:hypothetical protein